MEEPVPEVPVPLLLPFVLLPFVLLLPLLLPLVEEPLVPVLFPLAGSEGFRRRFALPAESVPVVPEGLAAVGSVVGLFGDCVAPGVVLLPGFCVDVPVVPVCPAVPGVVCAKQSPVAAMKKISGFIGYPLWVMCGIWSATPSEFAVKKGISW